MKRILSFFMVFVLLFNFVLPRRSEAVAPVAGAILANPKTYLAVGSLLASAGIVYENRESLIAGVNDFLNKSAEVREQVHNAMLISGIYLVDGIKKNIFPVSQELYDNAVDYASEFTGTSSTLSSVQVLTEYTVNNLVQNSIDNIIPYNISTISDNERIVSSKGFNCPVSNKPSYETDYTATEYVEYIKYMEKTYISEVTTDVGYTPFVSITPTNNNWIDYNSSINSNDIPFYFLGEKFNIFVDHDTGSTIIYNKYETNTSDLVMRCFSPIYISAQPQYTIDENGEWYSGMKFFATTLCTSDNASVNTWVTTTFLGYFLRCNTPNGVSSETIYNHPGISSIFTTYNESTGLYEPSSSSIAPTLNYSLTVPSYTDWDFSADEQVGVVLPNDSIDNYVGNVENVEAGEISVYTGEKISELDLPSIDDSVDSGNSGSISGDFDIGKWLTGTGAGTLSGTLDKAFSKVNTKIDSLSNVFNPELSWQNSNFRWFDFIILFLDVILACIRLTIRFLVFVVTLTQIVATPLISNSHMLQGIDFLKNITIPETNFTIWGLLTSFATAMIGVSAFKFIKRKFRF